MRRQKILLFGKNGQVAWELRRTLGSLGDVACLGSAEVNLRDPEAIRRSIRAANPTLVINAAAYTAVDKAESEPDVAMAINGEAPGVMALEAAAANALLVHYSTDYVFAGAKSTPYSEDDPTGPLGVYGHTKLAGEKAIAKAGGNHLIFRLCWVYGTRGNNFLLTMMRLAREREKLRVVADQQGSPTWSRAIAETTALALRQVDSPERAASVSGVYHLCASGSTTWHRFATAIIESMPETERKCREIEAIPTSAYPTPARRPAYSVMSGDKLERTFGLRLPHWRDSLDLVLEK